MDIYKLSDSVPEEKKADRRIRRGTSAVADLKQDLNDSSGQMIVTDLKQGLKNPNRVNVFIDGKFSFSLDVAQIVDYKLKKGATISAEKLQELKSASEFGKLYQRTLEWVLIRPRSVKETREYIIRKLKNTLRGPSATNEERASEVPPVTTGRDERVEGTLFWLSAISQFAYTCDFK